MRQSLRESLRIAIQDGRLTAGTVLPSSRRLAADLGVSRGVTTDAYEQLASEGYLDVRERAAPVVAAVHAAAPAAPDPHVPAWRFDLTAITPDVRLFPRREWTRAVGKALRNTPDAALDYGDHRGRIELRTALSSYLARVRGVRVDPGRIVVTQGFTQALDLMCRVLLARGARWIAVESPTHPDLAAGIEQSGLRAVGCAVDSDGLRTDDLTPGRADAIMVAPAHQFPTGSVMTSRRRVALLDWATSHDCLILEDDYDAEFRYDRTPLGAVQGLAPGRVVHIGTASKTLAPGVRLGWMSLPAGLVDEVRTRKGLADSGSPAFDQLAFAEFLTSGDYDRHVARARQTYRRRRDRLVRALATTLPELPVQGSAAGMHILLRLPDNADDIAIAGAAASQGIGVKALSPLQLTPSRDRGLVLGYGRLPETKIDEATAALAALLKKAGASRT
ncbi:PLP-dependent aminotransferase family protein [Kribbella sp. NPDC049227]|uniref:MocR-like pyridoxine biosynthesis transcription factor PdxR n=1 Tax=Kribbella sp. NPDC049227 TaxID=3364113 RepID=UPI00371ADF5D